jgi:hypothetical protein
MGIGDSSQLTLRETGPLTTFSEQMYSRQFTKFEEILLHRAENLPFAIGCSNLNRPGGPSCSTQRVNHDHLNRLCSAFPSITSSQGVSHVLTSPRSLIT